MTKTAHYPSGGVYAEALQDTGLCFSDDDLRGGRVQLTAMGTPRAISGNFASVFSVLGTDGKRYAIKCFTRDVVDLHTRYSAVSTQLSRLQRPWQVSFDYQPAGILVQGRWLPILKMEWIEARGLLVWLEANLHDPQAIADIAVAFATAVTDLQAAGLAHGDLQHGNLLVDRSGQLRLIDYDGMFLPSLAAHGAAEKGHINYQSPARTMKDYDATVDRFGAWLIYVSLLLLLQDPGLWAQFHADGEEKLLFGLSDFDDPYTLGALSDIPEMQTAVEYLGSCWSADTLIEIPDFDPAALPTPEELLEASPYVASAATAGARSRTDSRGAHRPPTRRAAGRASGLFSLRPQAGVDTRKGAEAALAARRAERKEAEARAAAAARALEASVQQEQQDVAAATALQSAAAERERAELTAAKSQMRVERQQALDALHHLELDEARHLREALSRLREAKLTATLQRYSITRTQLPGLGPVQSERLLLKGVLTVADIRMVQVFWSIAHSEWIAVIVKPSGQRVRIHGVGLVKGNAFKDWHSALLARAKASAPKKLPAAEVAAVRAGLEPERRRLTAMKDDLARRLAEETAVIRQRHQPGQLRLRQEQASARKAAALRRRQFQPALDAAQRELEAAQWAEQEAARHAGGFAGSSPGRFRFR